MKGSTSHVERMAIFVAFTSISPVGMCGLAMEPGRARTTPSTATQYSNFSWSLTARRSASASASITTWVSP